MLTRALARHCRVVYLECGVRSKLGHLMPWAQQQGDILVIYDAFRLRYGRVGRRFPRLASWLDGLWLRSLLKRLGIVEYVYWTSAGDPRLIAGVDTSRLVFDCIDPCFTPATQEEFDRDELAVVSKAKVVFATAESLLERMRAHHPAAFLLPNGAPDSAPVAGELKPVPSALAGKKGPVVGYMGTLDWRFDGQAVMEVARALPEVTFCLVGRIIEDQQAMIDELKKLPNVVVTGLVSRAEGEAFTARFDAGFIPFVPGPMNDAINPCKMYMYLWAGVPVVATDIRECRRHAPWVLCPDASRDLKSTIEQALQSSQSGRVERQAFALSNTWAVRADEAMKHLRDRGLVGQAVRHP